MLSVGNNSLSTTDGLLYLKCLDSLRVLNLCGNPVCADPEYRPYVFCCCYGVSTAAERLQRLTLCHRP